METAYKDYLWNHFAFNAEQRLKAFNFFVILAVFADGGYAAAIEKTLPAFLLILLGLFIFATAGVFLLIDIRSRSLLDLAIPGLREYETSLPENARIFTIDKETKSAVARYTIAFRALILLQLLFGAGVTVHGIVLQACR